MSSARQFPWQQEIIIRHTQRLLFSFQYWTGRSLLNASGSSEEIAKALFEAAFVLVSHGTELDPIFNYGIAKLWNYGSFLGRNLPECPPGKLLNRWYRRSAIASQRKQQAKALVITPVFASPALVSASTSKTVSFGTSQMSKISDVVKLLFSPSVNLSHKQ